MRRAGLVLLVFTAAIAVGAPWLAPHAADTRFDDLLFAPPTRVHLYDDGLQAPFIYAPRLVSRLERRFEEAREHRAPLRWLTSGVLVSTADPGAPLLLLGADAYGRDIFSRLLHGSRITLGLAALSACGAILLGAVIGGIAGYAGGRIDDILSRVTELVMVLPAMYVALALRALMPLVVPASTVFAGLTVIFILLGWPLVARGVRAIIASERQRDYADAARASGASPLRILVRHLLPAASGHLAVQLTLLVPAFILAEATLSYVGFGFPPPTATWGTLLQDAANVALLGDAPWMLAPAGAIFVVVLGIHLVVQSSGRAPVQWRQ